jgi:CO dehydrogenase/acetyl-CoA synthase gamma subunit (corrinoid Fe-S protein)
MEAPVTFRPLIITIPEINSKLTFADYWGAVKVRWNIGRDHYIIKPGLYKIGYPDHTSEVLVSANYKLSFDVLRKNLKDLNAWILVIDTKGINVWCAAGKGTFGTDNLVRSIRETQLSDLVRHRRIILPQLGAPGVAAHAVKELTGFKVLYGPVRAKDIPSFLQAGYKATPKMRKVKFSFFDRAKTYSG